MEEVYRRSAVGEQFAGADPKAGQSRACGTKPRCRRGLVRAARTVEANFR